MDQQRPLPARSGHSMLVVHGSGLPPERRKGDPVFVVALTFLQRPTAAEQRQAEQKHADSGRGGTKASRQPLVCDLL